MRLLWLLFTVVALTSAGVLQDSTKKRYDNFKVYKLNIQNKIQLAAIEKLGELTQKYNVWREYDRNTKQVDIMVNPEEIPYFQQLLRLNNITSEVMVENVQAYV